MAKWNDTYAKNVSTAFKTVYNFSNHIALKVNKWVITKTTMLQKTGKWEWGFKRILLTGSTIQSSVTSHSHWQTTTLSGAEKLLSFRSFSTFCPTSGLVLSVHAINVSVATLRLGKTSVLRLALKVALPASQIFWNLNFLNKSKCSDSFPKNVKYQNRFLF